MNVLAASPKMTGVFEFPHAQVMPVALVTITPYFVSVFWTVRAREALLFSSQDSYISP